MISVRQLFHIGIVVYYMIATHLIQQNLSINRPDSTVHPQVKILQTFSSRFLTIWTFILQSIYFFIALGEEVLFLFRGQEKIKEKTRKFKNYLFTVLAAPMALNVTVIFWSIWLIDRELIMPEVADKVLPPWMNHSLHTVTSVLVLLEMYLCYHKYPTFKLALLGITMYLLFYSICLFGTYFETGIWLYPVFKVNNWTMRISLCLGAYGLAIALYGAGYVVNKVLWGDVHVHHFCHVALMVELDEKIAARAAKASKKKHKAH